MIGAIVLLLALAVLAFVVVSVWRFEPYSVVLFQSGAPDDVLVVDCPNCFQWVDLQAGELEGMHNGMTVPCPKCGKHITFYVEGDASFQQAGGGDGDL